MFVLKIREGETTSTSWPGMRMLNFILLIANLNIAQIDRSIFKPPQQLNLKIESSKIEKTAFVAVPHWIIQTPFGACCCLTLPLKLLLAKRMRGVCLNIRISLHIQIYLFLDLLKLNKPV